MHKKEGNPIKGNVLSSALKTLLNEKLPESKIEKLKSEGFKLKSPTRKTALAIALYKKAEAGDLSAIKELRSVLSEDSVTENKKAVLIIDDTGNKD